MSVFRPFVIPTGAMEDTLQIGDSVLVNPWSGKPGRGDLVVFRYPI
jgi:signal peptidase I